MCIRDSLVRELKGIRSKPLGLDDSDGRIWNESADDRAWRQRFESCDDFPPTRGRFWPRPATLSLYRGGCPTWPLAAFNPTRHEGAAAVVTLSLARTPDRRWSTPKSPNRPSALLGIQKQASPRHDFCPLALGEVALFPYLVGN